MGGKKLMVEDVVEAVRVYNNGIQNLNGNPSDYGYDDKVKRINETFEKRIMDIVDERWERVKE